MNITQLKKIYDERKETIYVKVVSQDGVFEDSFIRVGMIFVLNNVTHQEGCELVYLNANIFKDYNRQFYTNDYYDKSSQPILNAEQAGVFPKNGIEELYVMADDCMFEVIEEPKDLLVKVPVNMIENIRKVFKYVDSDVLTVEDFEAFAQVEKWLNNN